MDVIGDIVVNGVPVARDRAMVSVLDLGFQRGYGGFEAMRAYGGVPFRMRAHLDRLAASLVALQLPQPDRAHLEAAVTDRARAGGDCIVRVYVSGGTELRDLGAGSTTVVLAEALPPRRSTLRIQPRPAPWHTDGEGWELTGAKTLSYAPNLAASLAANRDGFDDALLIGRRGVVLEGPTFSVAWVSDGVVETPSIALGILESITRSAAIEVADRLGLDLVEGEFELGRVLAASEVFVMSTVKEVTPVGAVGDQAFEPGPVTEQIAAAFRTIVAGEVAEA